METFTPALEAADGSLHKGSSCQLGRITKRDGLPGQTSTVE